MRKGRADYVKAGVFEGDRLVKTVVCLRADMDKQAKPGQTVREGEFTFQRGEFKPGPRWSRRREYPPVGDQLGAIVDLAKAVRDAGIELPQSVHDWIDGVDAVKKRHPK